MKTGNFFAPQWDYVIDMELDTEEIRARLGDVPLSHPLVRKWLMGYLEEGLSALRA